jgi:membrane protease YdiL (CAAX protease family)
MGNFSAYLHILIGICVYFVFAVLASLIAQKAGINLKELEGRTSMKLLGIGAAANLGALMAILLLMTWLDGKPIRSLGWDIQPRGLFFSFLAIIVTAILAWFFVAQANWRKRILVSPHQLIEGSDGALNFAFGMLVLLLVASQEEVLYRGYVLMNLSELHPIVALLVSTVIFTLVHFLTNKVSLHQIISWFTSGLLLGAVYMISGSILLAIIVHFVIDASNVIVFNVTGKFSLFTFTPALTERDRTPFRLLYTLTMLICIAFVYGPVTRLF